MWNTENGKIEDRQKGYRQTNKRKDGKTNTQADILSYKLIDKVTNQRREEGHIDGLTKRQ